MDFEDRPDPRLLERILAQLIEPEDVATPNVLDLAIHGLTAELLPMVDTRIWGLMSREYSWPEVVVGVSRDTLSEVGVPDTPPPGQLPLLAHDAEGQA